jgi:hypothetical protein
MPSSGKPSDILAGRTIPEIARSGKIFVLEPSEMKSRI